MKQKFLKLSLHHLRNEEWYNFFLEFKSFVLQFTPQALGIEAQFAQIVTMIQKADDMLGQIRKSALTSDIKRFDVQRDSAFRALKASWKYTLSEPEPQKYQAAERLGIVFNHFGSPVNKPYNEATGAIMNFLDELRGKYAADVEMLNLTDMVNKLEDANNAFEAAIIQRNAEVAGRPEMKMLEIRHETNRCYYDITERIEALTLLEGDERFAGFIRTLNTNIERYKRSHRSAKKDDSENGQA
ncbi:MAG: DUF6261 family protein [Tannerella sp.]|jgi:hypothetical protein|nr:DUF6261 family protein [Tannerella sp.]